jgi:hypothetical protein
LIYNSSFTSLQVLHEDSGIVLDTSRALQIAADVAKAMQFLHSLDRQLPRYHLNSKHIMVILPLHSKINAEHILEDEITCFFIFRWYILQGTLGFEGYQRTVFLNVIFIYFTNLCTVKYGYSNCLSTLQCSMKLHSHDFSPLLFSHY